jgi:hypothetical protein
MKSFRKHIAVHVCCLALTIFAPITTLAQVAYRSKEGYYFISKLAPGKVYHVNFEGIPETRLSTSNKCGMLLFKPSKNDINKVDKIEIKDEQANQTYGFSLNSLPVKEAIRCDGKVVDSRDVWINKKGYIGISGLTPSSHQIISFLSNVPVHNLRANECGFLRFRLDTVPTAFTIEGKAYPTNGQTGRGIYCKRGVLYVAYPNSSLSEISPVDEATWKQQHPYNPSFSPGTQVASFSNGGIHWGILKTVGNGGGGSSTQTAGSGSGGVTVQQPPSGQSFCRIGSSQLLVTGLTSGTGYYVSTPEEVVYAEATADSNGRAIFDGIDYTVKWEGQSAQIEIGKTPDSFIRILGSLSQIPLCH